MNKYILSCGSAVDLSREHLEKRGIDWIPFTYIIDDCEYKDDFMIINAMYLIQTQLMMQWQ